jgi:hypothetical protein
MSYRKFEDLPAEVQAAIRVGQIFFIRFKRRNEKVGEKDVREMFARSGVHKYVTGKGAAYNFSEKALLPVYDMCQANLIRDELIEKGITPESDEAAWKKAMARAYRCLPYDGIISVKVAGSEWDLSEANTVTHTLDIFDFLGAKKVDKLMTLKKTDDRLRYLKASGVEASSIKRLFKTVKETEILKIYEGETVTETLTIGRSVGLIDW